MRFVLFAMLALVVGSCREVLPLTSATVTIQGYQLNGTVTTPNGIPIDNVQVQLFYYYSLVSYTPMDTVRVVVSDPTQIVDIAVYTPTYQFVKQLFLGYRSPGVVPRAVWSGLDQNGVPVPNGEYLIRYVIDTTIVKYFPIIIDGNRTTTTGITGRFSLTPDRLPVGRQFDIYDDVTGAFIGVYAVDPMIDLTLRNSTLRQDFAGIQLLQGTIVTRTFILQ